MHNDTCTMLYAKWYSLADHIALYKVPVVKYCLRGVQHIIESLVNKKPCQIYLWNYSNTKYKTRVAFLVPNDNVMLDVIKTLHHFLFDSKWTSAEKINDFTCSQCCSLEMNWRKFMKIYLLFMKTLLYYITNVPGELGNLKMGQSCLLVKSCSEAPKQGTLKEKIH